MKKLLFAAAIIAVAFLSSCAGAAGDPKAVLGNFFEALSKKDMATARKLATDDSKAMLDLMEMGMKTKSDETEKFSKANLEFGEPKIDGDKAIVPVKEKSSNETVNYILKKEKGSWKVAFDKASIMSMGQEKLNEKGINITDSIGNMMEEINKVNIDSLKDGLQKGAEAMDSAAKLLEKMKQ